MSESVSRRRRTHPDHHAVRRIARAKKPTVKGHGVINSSGKRIFRRESIVRSENAKTRGAHSKR